MGAQRGRKQFGHSSGLFPGCSYSNLCRIKTIQICTQLVSKSSILVDVKNLVQFLFAIVDEAGVQLASNQYTQLWRIFDSLVVIVVDENAPFNLHQHFMSPNIENNKIIKVLVHFLPVVSN